MRKLRFVPVLVLFVVFAGIFSMMPGNMAADAKFSNVPATPCAPGQTATLTADSNFDLGTVTARITQNGVEHVSTLMMDKAHETDSMGVGTKGGGQSSTVWAGYRDADEVAELYMTVLYDKSMASTEMYDGLRLTFLVTELYGNNISVQLAGKKGGVDTTYSATVPAQAVNSSAAAVGKFMQKPVRAYFQKETVPIYGLGYNSSADIVIQDGQGSKVAELTAPCEGRLAYVAWEIPAKLAPGNYTVGIKPSGNQADSFGHSGVHLMTFEVVKSIPEKNGALPTGAAVAMPGWVPLAMVGAVLIVGVPIGVLLIRKKKD